MFGQFGPDLFVGRGSLLAGGLQTRCPVGSFFEGRWQSGQVKKDAANKSVCIGMWCRLQLVSPHLLNSEGIHG